MTLQSGSSLSRLVRRAAAASGPTVEETCELCAAPLPAEHRHVLDLNGDELRCACRACSLLFERDAAGRGHYRLLPERRVRLAAPEDAQLGVPVGLAFFVVQPDGAVLARYPSPMGATSWDVDADLWSSLVLRWPELSGLAPSVEALLVNTARERREHWIVPIDDCYRLVAVIREHWTGLSGGRTVWPAVDEFFAGLGAPVRGRMMIGSS